MKVLVTGAMGAIGSMVVHRLLRHGHSVIAFDQRDDPTLIADVTGEIATELGDIRDWAAVGRALQQHRPEVVIHMAALLPAHAMRDPKLAHETNVGGTVAVCELARLLDVRRVVFASSKGVYASVVGEYAHPTYRLVDEDYPIGPSDPYDVTKYCAEQLGLNYATHFGVDFVALRFAATYGPGRMVRHGAVAIRSAIVENAYFGRPTRLPSGADQLDDFVYTEDVAQALVRAAEAPALEHRIFNIGTGQGSTLAIAADILRDRFPEALIEIGPGPDYGVGTRYCVFDITRARRELGYEPEFDHARGIHEYLDRLEETS